MVGESSLCIEGRILSLNRAHVAHEQVNLCWPLPHVAGSPDRRVISSQSDCRQVIRSSLLCRLVGPYKLRLNLAALPCSRETLQLHASGTNPGSTPEYSP